MTAKERFETWKKHGKLDTATRIELSKFSDDDEAIKERFGDLTLSTDGIRALVGAGTSRLNAHTIRQIALAFAQTIKERGLEKYGVVIGYDTRKNSHAFALEVVGVLAKQGIHAFLFNQPSPTPLFTYFIRNKKAGTGIMITASHSSSDWNGVQFYDQYGSLVDSSFLGEMRTKINSIDPLNVPFISPRQAQESYKSTNIDRNEQVVHFARKMRPLAINNSRVKQKVRDKFHIVYSPLFGAGADVMGSFLAEAGNFFSLSRINNQASGTPEANQSQNPEDVDAYKEAIRYAEQSNGDLVLITDSDAGRLGVAVRHESGFKVLTSNQISALILQYLLHYREDFRQKVFVTTATSSELLRIIAHQFGLETHVVQSGFFNISKELAAISPKQELKPAEKIEETFMLTKDGNYVYSSKFDTGIVKKSNKKTKSKAEPEQKPQDKDRFFFAADDNHGFLIDPFSNNKDAFQAALIIADMAVYYKSIYEMSLYDVLLNMYARYGFFKEATLEFEAKGENSQEEMAMTMEFLRAHGDALGYQILEDYSTGTIVDFEREGHEEVSLPQCDMVKFTDGDENRWMAVRPSGTENKLKAYFGVVGRTDGEAQDKMEVAVHRLYDFLEATKKEYGVSVVGV